MSDPKVYIAPRWGSFVSSESHALAGIYVLKDIHSLFQTNIMGTGKLGTLYSVTTNSEILANMKAEVAQAGNIER